jgi:hypothetical protein
VATLGQSTGTGSVFTVSSTFGDIAGGGFTMPAGGGVVTGISVYAGNNGTAQNARLYVWKDSAGIPGLWIIQSTLFAFGGLGWLTGTGLSSGNGVTGQYIPGGTVIWVGLYCAAGTEQIGANAASGGGTRLGNTADGSWSDHGAASLGQMGAYITYTPGGVAHVRRGGVWSAGVQPKVSRSGVRVGASNIQVRRSGVWKSGV